MIASPTPLPIQTLQDIVHKPLPPVEWLVKPVIAKGERVLVYGEYGSFKSFTLLHMCLHLAAGKKWLDTFDVPKARPVLYIDEEMNEYTLKLRLQRLVKGSHIEPSAPFATLSRQGCMISEAGAKILMDRIERTPFKPDVVVLEALRRIMTGSENEAADVAAFWRACERIVRGTGISLIVSHHMRKPHLEGPDPARYRASGSTDLIAGSDSAWAMTRPHGQGDIATMEAIRIRLMKEPPPFAIEFNFQGEDGPVSARLGEDPQEASKGGQAVLLIEGAIRDKGPQESRVLEALCMSEGISRMTFFRALKSLQDQERITKQEDGTWTLK